MVNRIIFIGVVTISMTTLLYLMTETYFDIQAAITTRTSTQFLQIKMNALGFIFGGLTDWQALKNLVRGALKINWLIAPASLLTVLIFVPDKKWILWFGFDRPFFIEMFWIPEIQMLLTVFAGLMFIRSFAMPTPLKSNN